MDPVLNDLGPCKVTFNGVDLGTTKGGVKFKDNLDQSAVLTDQSGTTPEDHILTGRVVSVEVPLTRSNLAKLSKVIPGMSSFASYSQVRNQVGIARKATSAQLVLQTLIDGVASGDAITIFKASPSPDMEITFDNENQRIYKINFAVYPDTSNGNRMYRIGTVPTP